MCVNGRFSKIQSHMRIYFILELIDSKIFTIMMPMYVVEKVVFTIMNAITIVD